MIAVKKNLKNKGIILTDSPIPSPGPLEVLIKVRMAGICGTDLHIYRWDRWSQDRIVPPVIIGHEFVGEIEEIGRDVSYLQKGQRVSAEGHITCGRCCYCQTGQGHICKEVKIIGVDTDGCFADYLCIPAKNIWPINKNIINKYAAVFDPIGNAMHVVTAQQVAMKTVLITGAGSIGLFAILIAKANGAKKVIVLEPSSFKREIAEKVGADYVFDSNDGDIKRKIIDNTDGLGPDILLEMSGSPAALNLGLDVLGNGGIASLLGIPSKEVILDIAKQIIFKGITIHGITGRKIFETWYQCENFLLKNGKLIEPILTHCIDMKDIEEGFSLMENDQAAKVLIQVN